MTSIFHVESPIRMSATEQLTRMRRSILGSSAASTQAAAPPNEAVSDVSALGDAAEAGAQDFPARIDATWPQRYARSVALLDSGAIMFALTVAYLLRFAPWTNPDEPVVAYIIISFALLAGWLACLTFERSRDRRIVGIGLAEYGRVWKASWLLFATLAIVSYLLDFDLARGYVAVAFPVGVVGVMVGRFGARQGLLRLRAQGRGLSRIIVTGCDEGIEELISELNGNPAAGYLVIGACVPGGTPLGHGVINGVPILGDVLDVASVVQRTGASAVAICGSDGMTSRVVRDISYELEAIGTDLIVAPGLVDVAGPRVVMSPAEGLSLVHVDAPLFSGGRYVVKSVMDWTLALCALVVLALPMLIIGILVKATSAGPMLFRQERVGRNGEMFSMLKFRSMSVDAEDRLAELAAHNEASGPLFKVRNDPRVTRVGRALRRYSLDELPQFINVMLGQMSLVGPRPPLPSEVAQYDGHAARRMLVKPGLTGLWQISGRSDLAWDEGLRKDVYYVENWTVFGDLAIMLGTVRAMLAPNGAY